MPKAEETKHPVELYPEDKLVAPFELGNFITDKLGLRGDKNQWNFVIFMEALVLTAVSFHVGSFFDTLQPGIMAIFLITGALTPRLTLIIDLNRHNIWVNQESSLLSNWKTFTAILSMVLGIFLGCLLMAVIIQPIYPEHSIFQYIFQKPALQATLAWNFDWRVMITSQTIGILSALLLAFLYKAFGALLVLVINVVFWATSFVGLVHIESFETSLSSIKILFATIVIFYPSMFFNGLTLVLTCMGAIFLSKGFVRYSVREPRFVHVIKAVLPLIGAALVASVLTMLLQKYYIPWAFSVY